MNEYQQLRDTLIQSLTELHADPTLRLQIMPRPVKGQPTCLSGRSNFAVTEHNGMKVLNHLGSWSVIFQHRDMGIVMIVADVMARAGIDMIRLQCDPRYRMEFENIMRDIIPAVKQGSFEMEFGRDTDMKQMTFLRNQADGVVCPTCSE